MDLQKAKEMSLKTMQKHNLNDWTFEFSRGMKRIGECNHLKKIIKLSKHFVIYNDEPLVTNVLLHEIAHALVGRYNGHNRLWKRK